MMNSIDSEKRLRMEELENLSALQRSVLAMKELRARLDALESLRNEPVAIIGIACRFPGGAENTELFWNALRDGRDLVSEVPPERWNATTIPAVEPVAPHLRFGGFLSAVDEFDAQFFGMSPREAAATDPQQRIVLEVGLEALEDACLTRPGLRGSKTGVFIGAVASDYAEIARAADAIDLHSVTGLGASLIAGRVSHLMGFHGPALTIDTACSSSLVSVHLACQSLRLRECDLALAGGVNLMLTSSLTRAESKANMLSSGGRCRTFDSKADGIVRGEGCGVVVLKRLSAAVADGNRILAVIRGSAINHDGPSAGLTVPSETAQQQVIQQALLQADVEPLAVDYLEAHGTGTPLGDPIEINALASVYCAERPAISPLYVGSVKTNMGHLEASAGIAGLIKVVLSLQHDEIPAHLHFRHGNPHVNWQGLPIVVPVQRTHWSRKSGPRAAAVSAFGLAGTNAHVVITDPPPAEPSRPALPERAMHVLPLSARTLSALRLLAGRYADFLEQHPEIPLGDVCFTAATGRECYAERLAIIAATSKEMQMSLAAFARDEADTRQIAGRVAGPPAAPPFHLPDVSNPLTLAWELGRLFILGSSVDWKAYDQGRARRLIRLPSYPFERRRYWITARRRDQMAAAAVNHPADAVATYTAVNETSLPAAGAAAPGSFVRYYDSISELEQSQFRTFVEDPAAERYLTFAPFEHSIPGFSWLKVFMRLEQDPAKLQSCLRAQQEMRALLFDKIDFHNCRSVLDFGCGYGSDLITLARRYPHLTLDGFSISTKQTETGISRVDALQLRDRIRIYNRDSAADEFPGTYDMAFGFEVAHHIKNKNALFANLNRHLADQGSVLLADFISQAPFDVDHEMTSSYLVGKDVWCDILSHNRLRLIEAFDLSGEVANFLHDPDFTQNLDGLGAGSGFEDAKAAARSYDKLGRLLRKGLVSYVLLWAKRESHLTTEKVYQRNQERLRNLESYQEGIVGNSLYEVAWRPLRADQDVETIVADRGLWLVLADSGGVAADLAGRLSARNENVVCVSPALRYERIGPNEYAIDPSRAADYKQLIADVSREFPDRACTGVLHLWSLGDGAARDPSLASLRASQATGSLSAMHLVQALNQGGIRRLTRFCFVTRGSQTVDEQDAPPDVHHSTLWALAGVIANEYPELRVSRFDLPATCDARGDAEGLVRHLYSSNSEPQIAVRRRKEYVPRLVRGNGRAAAPGFFEDAVVRFPSDASYLISGGVGALGLLTAQWMVETGARNILLVSRSSSAQDVPVALREADARISVLQADVSDLDRMRDIFAGIEQAGPPLRGIIHAAGVLGDGILLQQNTERFLAALQPKMEGAWVLHELSKELALDFFLLYSSVSSVLGSPGQGSYAAANGFLDALAQHRRGLNLAATSINWGPWSDAGMFHRQQDRFQSRVESLGIRPLSNSLGLRLLARLIRQRDSARSIAFSLNPWVYLRAAGLTANSSFLSELTGEVQPFAVRRDSTKCAVGPASQKRTFASQEELLGYLRVTIANAVGIETDALDTNDLLTSIGLDSLIAVELKSTILKELGVVLDPIHLLDGISVAKLSETLYQDMLRRDNLQPETKAESLELPRTIDAKAAQELLENLDSLSEAEKDLLLERMLRDGEVPS